MVEVSDLCVIVCLFSCDVSRTVCTGRFATSSQRYCGWIPALGCDGVRLGNYFRLSTYDVHDST